MLGFEACVGLVYIHYEIQRSLRCTSIKFSFGSFWLYPTHKHYNLFAERPGNMAGQLWILATPTVKLSNMPKNHAVPWLSNWKLCAFRKPTKMQNSCLFISSSIISTNSCCSYSLYIYIYILYQQIRYHMTSQNAYSHDILLSGWDRGSEVNQPQRTELAGYGFGLPLTRRLVLAMSFWDWFLLMGILRIPHHQPNPTINHWLVGCLPVWYIDLFLGSSIDHLLAKSHTKVCMHNTLVGMSSCKLCQVPTSILFVFFIQRDVESKQHSLFLGFP